MNLPELIQFLQPYGPLSYYIILGMLLACGFGLPMPEDIILVSGGVLSALGVIDFWWVVFLSMIGVLGGDLGVFLIGRYFGPNLKKTRFFRRIMTPEMDRKAFEIYEKYGNKVIFMARFMPGLRMPMFLTAGIYQVAVWRFLAFNGFAALISVPLWVWVGNYFGRNLEVLIEKVQQFEGAVLSVVGLVVLFVVWKIYRARRKSLATEVSNSSQNPVVPPQ